MKRTDSAGSTVDNKYTNGDPNLTIPATVVDASWLNAVQEEIALFIEAQGITLNPADNTQLQQAIASVLGSGGTQTDFTIANGTGPANVTPLLFNKATVKAARVLFDLHRQTTLGGYDEIGELWITYDPVADDWEIQSQSFNDDADVTFTIDSSGQVQYTSSSLGGSSYSGTMRILDIKTIKQTA